MYHWSFIAAGSNMNFEADTSGGWQVYGDSNQRCQAPAEPRLAKKLIDVQQGFVTILPVRRNIETYDPARCGFDRIAQSNLDTNSAMISYYDQDPEMFALTVALCEASAPVWLDMLKFVRANSLRFTIDIGFVGFPPFTSHYEAVSYDEFVAAKFMERRAVFSAQATFRVLPVEKA
jgi:hypothetical protein